MPDDDPERQARPGRAPSQDPAARRTQSHADAELTRALRDRVRDQPVDTGRGEQQTDRREHRQHRRLEPFGRHRPCRDSSIVRTRRTAAGDRARGAPRGSRGSARGLIASARTTQCMGSSCACADAAACACATGTYITGGGGPQPALAEVLHDPDDLDGAVGVEDADVSADRVSVLEEPPREPSLTTATGGLPVRSVSGEPRPATIGMPMCREIAGRRISPVRQRVFDLLRAVSTSTFRLRPPRAVRR